VLDPIGDEQAKTVLARYAVGSLLTLQSGGGTANANARLTTELGAFFLRRRNPKYSAPAVVGYDHALMDYLQKANIGTPHPVASASGETWVELDGALYELFPFVEGLPHDPNSVEQLTGAGRALAQFHRATDGFSHPGKPWPRYRNPADIRSGLEQIGESLSRLLSWDELDYLETLTSQLEFEFTDTVYCQLPQTVVHGDWHPGNVLYEGSRICGIFDLDWASEQPRLLDLADGLFLFCGERSSPLDPTDIRSLTQSWTPSPNRWRDFLSGYLEEGTITEIEWRYLIPMVRARWLTCRFLGRSKVSEAEAAGFVANGLLYPLQILDTIALPEWGAE